MNVIFLILGLLFGIYPRVQSRDSLEIKYPKLKTIECKICGGSTVIDDILTIECKNCWVKATTDYLSKVIES